MSLLSDDEIDAVADKCFAQYMNDENDAYDLAFARAIEAAILAKLASAELPEPQKYPADCFMREVNVCDALAVSIAIQQAHAQGFAAGAAAQISEEPVAKYIGPCPEGDLVALHDDLKVGEPLYTRREAK